MHNLYIEIRRLDKNDSLVRDITRHMRTRLSSGSIAIVSGTPTPLMAAVKKEWLEYVREIKQERSKATDTTRPRESASDIMYMQSLTFNARSPFEDIQANISFSTPKEFRLLPPNCQTLYVTCEASKEDMYMITSWMPPHAHVVVYRL